MSKFFFKGRIDKREDYKRHDYKNSRVTEVGTKESPMSLTVASEQRKAEIETILLENMLFAGIEVNAEVDENIKELTVLLNKPVTVVVEKTPSRNDPCSCGSGNKYKKCCGK